jgi:hypothetical protein
MLPEKLHNCVADCMQCVAARWALTDYARVDPAWAQSTMVPPKLHEALVRIRSAHPTDAVYPRGNYGRGCRTIVTK